MRYAFIRDESKNHPVQTLCKVMKVHQDLLDEGFKLSRHRVYRLMRLKKMRAMIGYKRRNCKYRKPVFVAENQLKQNFQVQKPNQVWVTDITYVRTMEGWLYLCVVVDLFSRQVVGWSMDSRMQTDLVIRAMLQAIWRRRPENKIIIHSDQGSQYTSQEWQSFLKNHNLESSMSRRGNCYDNAVAESFFQLLKREKIRRKVFPSREDARSEIFDYIEFFYNTKRRHGNNQNLSPIDFEKEYNLKNEAV